MSFDRLYFARVIPLALLGVYGISRTISELLTTLVMRLGNIVVFPFHRFSCTVCHALNCTRNCALIRVEVPADRRARLFVFRRDRGHCGQDHLRSTLPRGRLDGADPHSRRLDFDPVQPQ